MNYLTVAVSYYQLHLFVLFVNKTYCDLTLNGLVVCSHVKLGTVFFSEAVSSGRVRCELWMEAYAFIRDTKSLLGAGRGGPTPTNCHRYSLNVDVRTVLRFKTHKNGSTDARTHARTHTLSLYAKDPRAFEVKPAS